MVDTKLYDEYNNLYELLQCDFIKIILKYSILGHIRHIIIENKLLTFVISKIF